MLKALQRWKEITEDHSRGQKHVIKELKEDLQRKPECPHQGKKRKMTQKQPIWQHGVEAEWLIGRLEEREDELQEDLEELWDIIKEASSELRYAQEVSRVEDSVESTKA